MYAPPRGRLVNYLNPDCPHVRELLDVGYTVVDVMTSSEADKYYRQMWGDVQSLGTGVKMDDPETWTPARWPSGPHGLLQHAGFGLSESACAARLATEPFWEKLFGVPPISSFDAVALARPGYQDYVAKHGMHRKHVGFSNWLHRDQAWKKTALCDHIQGALALSDLGPAELRTQIIVPQEGESAQSFNDRFLDAFPLVVEGATKSGFDPEREEWYKMTDEQCDWLAANGRAVAPTLKAGQMLLWASAMVHASIAGPFPPGQASRRLRMSVFVSALPRELLCRDEILYRRKLLEKGRTSGHRVCAAGAKEGNFRQCLFPKNPQTRGKPAVTYDTTCVLKGFTIYAGKKRGRDVIEAPSEVHRATARFCGGYLV